MTIEEIKEKTLESPALQWRSDKKGDFAYPKEWNDQVPLKVRMKTTVTSDLPMIFQKDADVVTIKGNEYYVWVNSYGAISAFLADGRCLGLKPDEFEVIEFHPKTKQQ